MLVKGDSSSALGPRRPNGTAFGGSAADRTPFRQKRQASTRRGPAPVRIVSSAPRRRFTEGAPAVLLLHGFPQHWYAWRRLLTELSPARHVIALDFPGSRWSDAPRRGYSTDRRIGDVLGVLDALELDAVDVVGHDWGALVAFASGPTTPGAGHRRRRYLDDSPLADAAPSASCTLALVDHRSVRVAGAGTSDGRQQAGTALAAATRCRRCVRLDRRAARQLHRAGRRAWACSSRPSAVLVTSGGDAR